MPATARVEHLPIVESDSCPRRVIFEGTPDDAEAFYSDYVKRDDVDSFYVVFVGPELRELAHDL